MTLIGENGAASTATAEDLERANARVAALERLIRAERQQYKVEQQRAAAEIERLRRGGGDAGLRVALARSKAEINSLLRYKRMVDRLQASPLFGPAHRVWSRSRAIRGYDQKKVEA